MPIKIAYKPATGAAQGAGVQPPAIPAPQDDLVHLRASVKERQAAGFNVQMPGPLCRKDAGHGFETLMSARVTCPICKERLEGLLEGQKVTPAPMGQTAAARPPVATPEAPETPKKSKPAKPAKPKPLAENDEANF